jgi:hypothetical protein
MSRFCSGDENNCQPYDQRCFSRFDATVLDRYHCRVLTSVFRESQQSNDETTVMSCLPL